MVGPNTQKNTPARQKAQAKYNSKPEQVQRRTERNQARAKMMAAGKVSKGDGLDVHHRNRNTSDNSSRNLAVTTQAKNRSIRKK